MTVTLRGIVLAIAILAVNVTGKASAGYITPVSATGTGTFNGSPSLIIDGVLPPRGTQFNDPMSVSWTGTSAAFTIDFGKVQTVGSLVVVVDNNDDYLIQYSTDGSNFKGLFTFLASDGPVGPGQGGLDLLTTDPSYPASVIYPPDSTTPEYVGRGFIPVDARYLRISAANGDSLYGVAEVDAYTPNVVPEPSSLLLSGVAGLFGCGYWLRTRRRATAR